MIEVEDLTFRYPDRRQPALRGVSFACAPGSLTLIMGPSGCGKSTLALCLSGAIPHSISGEIGGTVRVAGGTVAEGSMAAIATRVGIVFQDPEAQFCMLRVNDEVAFGLENLGVAPSEMEARIDLALSRVGLVDRRGERIEQLSGGQKQRLALACVLAQGPEVLVFDEPTAQLDPAGARDFIGLLAELRARGEHTIVLVEHRLDGVMHLVDQAVVLAADGSLAAVGPPRDVLRAHAGDLMAAGVWVPEVSELAHALQHDGLDIKPFPITLDEAAERLRDHIHPETPPTSVTAQPRPDEPPALDVAHLSFSYARAGRPVLEDVTFRLRPRELVGLVGPNGAGKSTLARLVAGVLAAPKDAIHLESGAGSVGYVFQYPEHQFVAATAVEDVAYGPRRRGVPEGEAREQALRLLAELGLSDLAQAHPFSLSLGEQRRLSVADMLVLRPQVLILDEPTFGQDRGTAAKLHALMRQVADSGSAVLAITHDVKLVSELDRVLALVEGRLVFDGSPRELFGSPELMASSGITPPPLWQLSQRLGLQPPLLRVDDLVATVTKQRRAGREVVRLA